ncbi:SH3 domain-containing protein [Balneolaceae bacterium YR4-1]|uniref:SH3 domain-containing protein n=1 Tax=Halalkalibaculum roseum TaxID=2709311 RepID=A0A6M1SM79_9BACT|nr:SH3 domain-containing protein [Halalkalibaculum roseum]NGP76441.1 SH3 domain-containing protein [Halalkalibaculum roseum]
MKRSFNILLISLIAFSGLACTGARWTVKDKSAVDRDDYSVISTEEILEVSSPVTPESPNLKLQMLSNTKYEFAEKVLVQRSIQDYKLKPGFVALGLIGACLAAYAANSNAINGGQSSAASLSLNSAAVIIAGATIMNLNPAGNPRETGEERFLRKTGSFIEQDTLQVESTEEDSALIDIRYGEEILVQNENQEFRNGELSVNLGSLLSSLELQGIDTKEVRVDVTYADSVYTFKYPLNQILQPFARITSPVAELRSKPDQDPGNILAELIQGSQLQILENVEPDWYRILYGISENYIAREDAELIWRNSDFSRESEVVAVPIVPFGNVDVESNIPILSGVNPNSRALVISNENYSAPFEKRSHAHRDARLIKTYLENAIGLIPSNIYELKDITDWQSVENILSEIKSSTGDSTDVYVYLNGYGTVEKQNDEFDLGFKTTGSESDKINMGRIFNGISTLTNDKLILLADIEFRALNEDSQISESEIDLKQPLRGISQAITGMNSNATVIFGSQINQQSELYVSDAGEDKKHHIFPYFFARALQERRTEMGSIFQFLQRNIPYTSRRLHDRSQDPQMYGNTSQELIPER